MLCAILTLLQHNMYRFNKLQWPRMRLLENVCFNELKRQLIFIIDSEAALPSDKSSNVAVDCAVNRMRRKHLFFMGMSQ